MRPKKLAIFNFVAFFLLFEVKNVSSDIGWSIKPSSPSNSQPTYNPSPSPSYGWKVPSAPAPSKIKDVENYQIVIFLILRLPTLTILSIRLVKLFINIFLLGSYVSIKVIFLFHMVRSG